MIELQIIYHVSINNDIVLISPLRIIGVLHVLISLYSNGTVASESP